MQGLYVDIWYFKISIVQDNVVFILLRSVASLWQSLFFVTVPAHNNCSLKLTVTKR
jgi:hypothetical protein